MSEVGWDSASLSYSDWVGCQSWDHEKFISLHWWSHSGVVLFSSMDVTTEEAVLSPSI